MGGSYHTIRLTLQEYFEKLGADEKKWGKPFSALLGAHYAQMQLGIPAIGGKDSMSGTFKDLNVPPTLVAFAVTAVDVNKVISPEFKQTDSQVVLIPVTRDANELPDFQALGSIYQGITNLMHAGKITAAFPLRHGGAAEAISKMCFGNRIGFKLAEGFASTASELLFSPDYGSLLLEVPREVNLEQDFAELPYKLLGYTHRRQSLSLVKLLSTTVGSRSLGSTFRKSVSHHSTAYGNNRPPSFILYKAWTGKSRNAPR